VRVNNEVAVEGEEGIEVGVEEWVLEDELEGEEEGPEGGEKERSDFVHVNEIDGQLQDFVENFVVHLSRLRVCDLKNLNLELLKELRVADDFLGALLLLLRPVEKQQLLE
jgi:hypothetical protein